MTSRSDDGSERTRVALFGLLGTMGGAWLEGFSGALFGLAIGLLWARVQALGARLTSAEWQVRALEAREREDAGRQAAAAPAQAPRTATTEPTDGPGVSHPPSAPAAEPGPRVPVAPREPAAASGPRVTPPPASAPPPRTVMPDGLFGTAQERSAPPRELDAVQQWIIGFFTTGNMVVKVGVVILFFGVAFLVRYAADRGLLPIEYRLMAVTAGALVMLGVGWRLRHSRPEYASSLQGGAVGVLYLTIFAAFRLYDLLPATLAFALLLLVVLLSGMLAVLQNTVPLAALGTAGGFLAPILASTGAGSHVALFSYYLVLNTGVLGIAWFRSWRILNWLGFVFTFGIAFVWGAQYYQPSMFQTTAPFLAVFFLLYVAVAVLFAHRQAPDLRGLIDGSLVFGTPAIAFAMQSVLVREIPFGRAFSAVAVSALYLVLARVLWRREPAMRPLAEAFLAIGVVFLTLAVPFAFGGHATAAAWALEGAGLVWVGVRQQRLAARLFGTMLQIGAGVAFSWVATRPEGAIVVLNGHFLGALAIAIGSILSARQFDVARVRGIRRAMEAPLEWVLLVWGLLWWAAAIRSEVDTFTPFRLYPAVLLLAVAASACLAGWTARRWAWQALRLATLVVLPLLWLVAVLNIVLGNTPWEDLAWAAWPAAAAASLLLLRWCELHWPPRVARAWHAGTMWLLGLVVTWAVSAATDVAMPESSAWATAMWGAIPALLLLALLRFGRLVVWPVLTFDSLYFGVVPLAPIGFLLLWVLLACTRAGDPAPLPYVPLVNPLEAAQAFVMLTFFRWWRTPESRQALGPLAPAALPAGALVAFAAANALVGRIVHFSFGEPYTLDALTGSAAFQAGISVLWAVTALSVMMLASRRAARPAWFAGAALLALLVIKLFTVDLGNVGGVARIVSFLFTGVLILVIGYFSPMPPRDGVEAQSAQIG